jgi:hypothetical protein
MPFRRLAFAAIVFLSACGGGGSSPAPAPAPAPVAADISVLMFGNSHTSANDLPGMLAAMLRAGRPGKTVSVVNASGFLFLEERLNDTASMALFNSRKWNVIVLQAQKYSSSGQFQYSIEEAVELVRRTRAMQALPVMFPEWPRRGIDETARIFDLHVDIARRQPACVATIPQSWDLAALRLPSLVLHAEDGNHAAAPGSFLAALMLYATMTGNSPANLPALPGFGINDATQASLRAVANEQVGLMAQRQYCPADSPL